MVKDRKQFPITAEHLAEKQSARGRGEAEVARLRERCANLETLAERHRKEIRQAQAEVARLRARTPVEAEDVERAGVTWAHVDAWIAANDYEPWSAEERARRGRRGCPSILGVIKIVARDVWPSTANAWRVLDEMAAMEVASYCSSADNTEDSSDRNEKTK